MILGKERRQKRVILRIDVPDESGATQEYYFDIPRQTVGLAMSTTAGASGASSEQLAGVRMFNSVIDKIKPATDRGTTISFREFLDEVIPDVDAGVLQDIVSLANLSDAKLAVRDDCELIEQ